MPHEHPAIIVIQRFYDAEAAYLRPGGGNFDALVAMLDPECVLYQPASLPYGGEWHGPEGSERWLKAFSAQWSSLEVKDSEFYPVADLVFSRSHVYAVARTSYQAVDWPLLQFFRMRGSKILELRPFHWDTAAMMPALLHWLPVNQMTIAASISGRGEVRGSCRPLRIPYPRTSGS